MKVTAFKFAGAKWVCAIRILVLIVAALLTGTARSEAQAAPALQTVYSHFIGTWSGTDEYRSGSRTVTIPVTIIVSETKNQKALTLDYVYSQKGKKDYRHLIRFMTIDPEKKTVTLNWQYESKSIYRATGLDEFMKTGYGTFGFSIWEQESGPAIDSRCTLQLTTDTFSYSWEESVDASPLQTTGTWKLSRVLPPEQPSR